MRLGLVHDVDVLREEHDLADRTLQLSGVVGSQWRLGLTDAPDHGEDIVSPGAGGLRLLELVLGDQPHDVVVDLSGCESTVAAGLDDAAVASGEALPQLALGLSDAASELIVELHRQVGDQLVGQVGGDVLLLATHDAHRDDRIARLRVEGLICRGETRRIELLHELGPRLLAGGPAEEAPDRVEVLHVVDQRRTREGEHQGVVPGSALAHLGGQRQHVLGTLRGEILDEVRLVDDHAAQPDRGEPGHVPIEDLVVHDEHVGERIDVVAVTLDHRGTTLWSPALDLARPVHLHDVGDDDEQRVRARHGSGKH